MNCSTTSTPNNCLFPYPKSQVLSKLAWLESIQAFFFTTFCSSFCSSGLLLSWPGRGKGVSLGNLRRRQRVEWIQASPFSSWQPTNVDPGVNIIGLGRTWTGRDNKHMFHKTRNPTPMSSWETTWCGNRKWNDPYKQSN